MDQSNMYKMKQDLSQGHKWFKILHMVIMLFKYPQIGRVALLYLLYYLIDAKWLLTVRLQPNLLINFPMIAVHLKANMHSKQVFWMQPVQQ